MRESSDFSLLSSFEWALEGQGECMVTDRCFIDLFSCEKIHKEVNLYLRFFRAGYNLIQAVIFSLKEFSLKSLL